MTGSLPPKWKDGLPLVRMGSAIHKPSQARVSTKDSRYKLKLLSLLKVEWLRRAGSWTVQPFSIVVLRDVLIRPEASKRSQAPGRSFPNEELVLSGVERHYAQSALPHQR